MDVAIHLLYRGNSVCGLLPGPVAEWPQGHEWTYLKFWEKATCGKCQALALEILSKQGLENSD